MDEKDASAEAQVRRKLELELEFEREKPGSLQRPCQAARSASTEQGSTAAMLSLRSRGSVVSREPYIGL